MNGKVLFSHGKDDWTTPKGFFDELNTEFGFTVDVAASKENSLCRAYYGLDHKVAKRRDALKVVWSPLDIHWMNPPYSQTRAFMAKAALERNYGVTTVALPAARVDTRWFHESVWNRETHHCRPGVEIRFIKGRLKFGGSKNGAPFPSVVVVFRGEKI